MALTDVEKMKVLGYVKKRGLGDLYYGDMEVCLNRKGRVEKQEILDFFTDYFIKNFSNESVSQNLKTKVIVCLGFLTWSMHEHGEVVRKDTLSKLCSIKRLYSAHFGEIPEDDKELEEADVPQLTKFVKALDDNLNVFFPAEENETKEESVSKDLEGTLEFTREDKEELEALLNEKKKELDELKKTVKKLEKKVSVQSSSLEEKKKQIRDLSQKNKNYENKLNGVYVVRDRLVQEADKLKAKIVELEAEIARLNRLAEVFSNDKCEALAKIQEVQEERNRLEALILEYQRREEKRFLDVQSGNVILSFDENIKKMIMKIVSKRKSTIGDIVRGLNDRGVHLTRAEIKEYLKELKRTININVNDDREAEIERPSIEISNTFNIPMFPSTRCIDLLAVSDFHITDFDSKTIRDLDIINEYCAQEGIGIILNGGDFFSFKGRSKSKRHLGVASWQHLVEKAILHYPYDESLIHLVLGGNHDRESLTGGIDAIKTLATERIDFAYLGYGSARITFNGSVSQLNSIGLHHPNTRYPAPISEYEWSTEKLQSTINSYFIRNGETRDTYIDLVGHIHKSGLDMDGRLCILPSYMKDRVQNGAWHLKVYFDADGNISNIVLMPLIKGKKLEKITEINYVKKLTKEK